MKKYFTLFVIVLVFGVAITSPAHAGILKKAKNKMGIGDGEGEKAKIEFLGSPASNGQRIDVVVSDDSVALHLDHFIVPDGEGSWMTPAAWYEAKLVLRNLADEPITVRKVWAEAPNGLYVEPGANIEGLVQATEEFHDLYRDIWTSTATYMAASQAASSLYMSGAIGAGGLAWAGPVGWVAAGTTAVVRRKKRNRQRETIESINEEFGKRSAPTEFTLGPNGIVDGSYFYPVAPYYSKFVVEYYIGADRHMLSLEIPDNLFRVSRPDPIAQTAAMQ